MELPPIVSEEEWQRSHEQLLAKEKEATRAGDQLTHLAHVNARDTTFAFVSRAPQARLRAYSERMGWEVPWYTDTLEFQEAYDATEWFAGPGGAGSRRSAPPGLPQTPPYVWWDYHDQYGES